MADKKLTAKQQTFVNEYLIDLNATQAAIRAGYSENTAKEMGYENLTKPHISDAIHQAMKKRAKETKLDANWVLKKLEQIAERCTQAEPVRDSKGELTGEFRFDSSGANKAVELIGKHLKMFTDKVEQDTNLTVVRKSYKVE